MEKDEEEALAIGIDLGTRYSCVAVSRDGTDAEIIPNDRGNKKTPSCVAFTEHERLVGDYAKNQAARNAKNTIYDAKRLIGRRFSDQEVQSDMRLWPFTVIGKDEKPYFVVEYQGEERHFCAEEISSMVLGKLKAAAEIYLGHRRARKAVVTVPAYFNNSQRQATKDAARIAGFSQVEILNEPTAAAIAYGLTKMDDCEGNEKRTVLIFNLGSGTLDVSVLEIDARGNVDVKATGGDAHFGGEDFNHRMIDRLISQLLARRDKLDVRENKKAIGRLAQACEKAKRELSSSVRANIEIDSLQDGVDFSTFFTRAKFEQLNGDLFDKCLETVEKALQDACLNKNRIHDVVLVGGSTRIPRIREMLTDFFDGKNLCHNINEDEVVAYGAAVHAFSMNRREEPESSAGIKLNDVTRLSLGFRNSLGEMHVMIPRNTRIPHRKYETCITSEHNQTSVAFDMDKGKRGDLIISGTGELRPEEIERMVRDAERFRLEDAERMKAVRHPHCNAFEIFEGEGKMVDQNHRLKMLLQLTGIRPALVGAEVKFRLTYEGTRGDVTISGTGDLSPEEIERMVREAERFRLQDLERMKAVLAKNALEAYACKLKGLVGDRKIGPKIGLEAKKRLEIHLNEVCEWLEDCEGAAEHEILYKKNLLEREWDPIKIMLKSAGVKHDALDMI